MEKALQTRKRSKATGRGRALAFCRQKTPAGCTGGQNCSHPSRDIRGPEASVGLTWAGTARGSAGSESCSEQPLLLTLGQGGEAARGACHGAHRWCSRAQNARGSWPQHSPASKPMLTNTRMMGKNALSLPEKQANPRILPPQRKKKLLPPGSLAQGHEDTSPQWSPAVPTPRLRLCWEAMRPQGTGPEQTFWGHSPAFHSRARGRKPHLLWTRSRKEVSLWLTALLTMHV